MRGLKRVSDVVVSPDGQYVYAAGRNDHSVAIFSVAADGSLTYLGRVRDNLKGVDGLRYVSGLTMSPDGAHLYAAGYGENELAVFEVNNADGGLTFVERKKQGAADGSADINGMKRPIACAVSPDGRSVYVAGYASNGLAVFDRDILSGQLTFREFFKDGQSGVNGLRRPQDVAVSPDGSQVIAAGFGDNAIALFNRDLSDGSLTFDRFFKDGVSGINGLNGVRAVAYSADAANVYAAGNGDDAIAVFARNQSTGALTFVEDIQNGGAVQGLNGASDVGVSPDGSELWSVAAVDDALSLFKRNIEDGSLEFVDVRKDGIDAVDGLDGATSLAISPSGEYVFSAGKSDDALAVFLRNCAPQAVADLAADVNQNANVTIDVLTNDSDFEDQNLSITAKTNGGLGTVGITGGGTTVDYTAGASAGADTFTYTIDDGHGGSSTATVSIAVVQPKRGAGQQPLASDAQLLHLYPNPASGKGSIQISSTIEAAVRIRIRDIEGRLLHDFSRPAALTGAHVITLQLDGRDTPRLSAGLYIVSLQYRDAQGRDRSLEQNLIVHD